jgi:GNAT superfamily N-acetyltransferase
MTVAIRVLDAQADRANFDCGVPLLNEWLQHQAGQAQRKRLASVWIAVSPAQPNRVLGYYSLAPWQIAFEGCPESLRKRLPRYPVHVSLIARLAVDREHQGKGLGGVLLADALKRTWLASEAVPVQAVLVHAKDDRAAQFYRNHGFIPFPHEPHHLYLPMQSVSRLFE